VGLEGVAIAERAYQHAAQYAKERVQGRIAGRSEKLPIVHHADVQRMLMRMKTQTEAMRTLAYLAAAQSDFAQKHPDKAIREATQLRVDLLTPIVKAWCTEQAIEIASLGIQVHGGMGYIEETGAAQYLRDARITSIYEGTTGIQAIDLLGRKIIRDEGAEAHRLLAEIQACATDLSSSSKIPLQQIATDLQKAVQSLSKALDWVLHEHATNPQAIFTGAYPLLQCFGFVCGGWLMAKAAFVSEGILQGDARNAFALQKIASATFYTQAILPQVHGLADTVCAGASLAQAMRDSLADLLR
jgi:hypothetical protein